MTRIRDAAIAADARRIIATLTAERDQARDWAAALESELARVTDERDELEADLLEHRGT